MKKIIIIIGLIFIAFLGFSQNEGENININNSKLNNRLYGDKSGGIDTLIVPDADSLGQYKYMNMLDPANDLDGVNLRTMNDNLFLQPLDSVFWNRSAVTTGHNPYKVDIDTTNGTLRMYNDEADIAMQMGQELWLKVKNNNGSTFDNGIIVYISGGVSGFPTVSIAHNRDFSMVDAIGMLTHDVEAGTFGFLTTYGTVGGLDTSGETEGARVYVDTLVAGKNWTTTIPEFANFQYEIGFIHTVDPTEGKIFINPKGQIDDIMHNINNANILEDFSFISSSDGTTIWGILNSTDGKDYLTLRWSEGFAKYLVPDTIVIPPGTDNNSQTSYIYIPKSTEVLTSSTSYFPIGTQYKTIARTNAWSPLRTQSMGLKGNQNYNDYVANTTSQRGRIAQVGNRQRWENLKYINGSFGTVTVRTASAIPDTVTFAVTQGNWTQANEQVAEAMDMFTGKHIHVFNYPDHADTVVSDLNEILIDATGASITGKSWTWVFWITQNKTGEPSHMYVNLPNGSYSSGADAEADVSGFKVTDIPYEMRPYSGFVTEVTMTHTNPSGGTWVVYSTADIQGNEPGYSGGGAGGSTSGTFDGLTDTPASKAGSGSYFVTVDPGEADLVYTAKSAINIGDFNDDGTYMDNATHNAAALSTQYVGTTDIQTLTNKTLDTPTIADFTNATHDHSVNSEGGVIDSDDITEGSTNLFSPFTDAGTEVYPTNNENIRVGDGSNTDDKWIYLQRGTLADGFIDTRLLNSGGDFSISSGQTSTWTNRFEIDGLTGQQTWASYTGTGSHSGTAAANIQVDASGNVITTAIAGSSLWSTDANGIVYNADNVGIGVASSASARLKVTADTDDVAIQGIGSGASQYAIQGSYSGTGTAGAGQFASSSTGAGTLGISGTISAGGSGSSGVKGVNTSTTTSLHYGGYFESNQGTNGIGVYLDGELADVRLNGSGIASFKEVASTATPPTGYGDIYFKTDGLPYAKDDAGTEYDLSATGSTPTRQTLLTNDATLDFTTASGTWAEIDGMQQTTTLTFTVAPDFTEGLIRVTQDGTGGWGLTIAESVAAITSIQYSGGLKIINPDPTSTTRVKFKVDEYILYIDMIYGEE